MVLRYCGPESRSPEQGIKMLEIVIPFLLRHGLLSAADDVKKYSLRTILDICKKAGPLLVPHAANIVETLLEGMSSLEPQSVNYLSFHIEQYNISQEQVRRMFS
jgi:proteasome component ECM29